MLTHRGVQVPPPVTLFVMTLPWLLGLTSAAHGVNAMEEAVALANPDSQALLVARGLSEVLHARYFGGWMTAALLVGTAGALILGAVLQSERRTALGLSWGLAGLPLLILSVVAALSVTFAGPLLA